MSTDIFSVFDQEDAAFEPGFSADGSGQEFNVEGTKPGTEGAAPGGADSQAGASGEEDKPKPDTVTISKEQWDNTQAMLNEFKGYIAAQNKPREPERPQYVEPQRTDPSVQQQQSAQLEQFLNGVSEDLTSMDPVRAKAAVQKILAAGAQIGYQQAQSVSAPAQQSTADLFIENFVARKSAKDKLYDKGVGEKFEQQLAQIDTRAVAGRSRAEINQALEVLYQRAKGDWADEQFAQAEERRAKAKPQGEPTNYGGGRTTATGGNGARQMKVPNEWKEFAKQAGIPEDQIDGMFAAENE